MTLFTRKRTRSIAKARRDQPDSNENFSPSSLNVQLLRENPHQLDSDQILHLQGMVGNSATRQLLRGGQAVQRQSGRLIQRMPTAQIVESTLGPPKKDTTVGFGRFKKVKAQSTKYKAVLAALRAFETYAVSTYLARDTNGLRAQMTAVNNHLITIYNAMNAYQGQKGKKALYMLGHLGEVKTFQNIAARAFLDKMDKPDTGHVYLAASLNGFLNKALREGGSPPLKLNPSDQLGSKGGGSKVVDQYDLGGGESGYFSDKKNTINDIDSMDSTKWNALRAEVRKQVEAEAAEKGWSKEEISKTIMKRMNAKMNEEVLGVRGLGIDPNDARMNNRDIAMSRLDQLLGTHLIARAQLAVVHMPDGSKREGSIMAEAKGMSPNDHIEKANKDGGSSKDDIVSKRVGAIGLSDPELMRQLSRLQLLDIIASQVDRNIGNFYVYRDTNGKLVALTGIDNDFSFGTNTDPNMQKQELPGISRYVDKELAQTIIALDPALLEPVLSDLLPQREIEAAMTRLTKLQSELQSSLTNLLEPDEWTAHSKEILDENKSYYANLDWRMKDKRSVDFKG